MPARTSLEMHGARRSQISSPGQRARPQTIVSSRLAFTDIHNHMAQWKTPFRMKLLPEMHLRPRTCVSAEKDKPSTWAAVSPLREPDRRYVLPAEGEHTGKD